MEARAAARRDYREWMSGWERWAVVLLIAATVAGLAWLARYAARDVAKRGRPGWLVGVLILIVPPAGALMWLWYRDRPELSTADRSPPPPPRGSDPVAGDREPKVPGPGPTP